MEILNVNASKNYCVYITNNFENLKEILSPYASEKNVLIVTDEVVEKLYYSDVLNALDTSKVYKFVIKANEESKNIQNYISILNFLCENSFDRSDLIVALGGGVVSDLAGFVASTYMRGISFITIPTTILAAVDASVGGKTAVNMATGKNIVGAFYQPSAVYINVETFKTLPKSEYESGFGEIIKYFFIDSLLSYEDILSNDMQKIVKKCLTIKSKIVCSDEKESGDRKLLNFGHTIGHAVEKLYKYKVPHGICVIIGINYALSISLKYFNLSAEVMGKFDKIKALIKDYKCNFTSEEILKEIYNDKKRKGDSIDFVMVKDLSALQIVNLKIEELGKLL